MNYIGNNKPCDHSYNNVPIQQLNNDELLDSWNNSNMFTHLVHRYIKITISVN